MAGKLLLSVCISLALPYTSTLLLLRCEGRGWHIIQVYTGIHGLKPVYPRYPRALVLARALKTQVFANASNHWQENSICINSSTFKGWLAHTP